MLSLSALSGCKGGGGGSSSAQGATANADAPTISGSAAATVRPNSNYLFQPTATDPNGDALSFQIENKPTWATFNTVTGELSGRPTLAHKGTYENIVISASDGKATARLNAFAIMVDESGAAIASNAVTLAWTAPTERVDGTPVDDLTGYVIAYGPSSDNLSQSVMIDNASVDRFVFNDLEPGTYYFAVRAITAGGAESDLSNPVSKEVG
jgi:hypothetical protein